MKPIVSSQLTRGNERSFSFRYPTRRHLNSPASDEGGRTLRRCATRTRVKVFIGFTFRRGKVTGSKVKRRSFIEKLAVDQRDSRVAISASGFVVEFERLVVISPLAVKITEGLQRIAEPRLEIEHLTAVERQTEM